MNTEQEILVYEHMSSDEPRLLGRLFFGMLRGSERYSFEYAQEWLDAVQPTYALDPELLLFPGRQYASHQRLFGVFSDASPDHWGRVLMEKRERLLARTEGRKPRKMYDIDYLLGVDDETRMGALRFKTAPDKPFIQNRTDSSVPPIAHLRELEEAARHVETDNEVTLSPWLEQLLSPGSSLGGARPKATVLDSSGNLWIAKFPSKYDEWDKGAWEMVTHELARLCGLNVPEAQLQRFSDYGSTFLTKRFDRKGHRRVQFASAMTLLNKTDGENARHGSGYLDIASFIRANGSHPKTDLAELWKRIVFNMAVSNDDDHLRNHACILTRNGWELSPMFDVNPSPSAHELSLNVSETDNTIDAELALDVAPHFGLGRNEAISMLTDISKTVRCNWKSLAKRYHIANEQIEIMRPAFESSLHS